MQTRKKDKGWNKWIEIERKVDISVNSEEELSLMNSIVENEDILNRGPFIEKIVSLIGIIEQEGRSLSLAIDGRWGSGKTFVLNELEKELESMMFDKSNSKQFYVFHYNCWQYDYYDEPVIAIVSAMQEKVLEETKKLSCPTDWEFAKTVISEIAGTLIKNKIGIDPIEIIINNRKKCYVGKSMNSEFDQLFSFKDALEKTRENIEKLGKRKEIVIVVDELDRCLPEYAIKVLERMHHLFEGIDNVIVIYAVDSKQIEYSIKTIFGECTDVDRYLKRFIDLTLELNLGYVQDGLYEKYASFLSMFDYKDRDIKNECYCIFKELCDNSLLDIRSQGKVLDKIEFIHRLMPHKENENAALLMFELLISITMASLPVNSEFRDDLTWIIAPNSLQQHDLEKEIGSDLLGYLLVLEKNAVDKDIDGESVKHKKLKDRPFAVAFLCIENNYSKEKIYYVENYIMYDELFKSCNSFLKLADTII